MYPDIEKDYLRTDLWIAQNSLRTTHEHLMRAEQEVFKLKAVQKYYRNLIKRFCRYEMHVKPGDGDFVLKEIMHNEPFIREGIDKPLTPKRLQELIKYVQENPEATVD